MLRRINIIEPRTEHRHSRTARAQGSPVCRQIDPARQTADDYDASRRQLAAQPLANLKGVCRCGARTDNRYGRLTQRLD